MYDHANDNRRLQGSIRNFSQTDSNQAIIFALLYQRLAETGIIARNNTITDRERPRIVRTSFFFPCLV